MKVIIKQNAWIAWLAAMKLNTRRAAIVIGKTIYLWNITADEFLNDKEWLCHETAHVGQYKEHGFLRFLFLYLMESIKNGYAANRFETAARAMEKKGTALEGIEFLVER